MASRNPERLRERRWLRALQLAKLLFEDEGYFVDYLEQIEGFIKDNHPEINGAFVEFRIKDKEIAEVKQSRRFEEDCPYCQGPTDEDIGRLTIDTAKGYLYYTSNIGKYFSFKDIRVVVCFSKDQITCKLQSLRGEDQAGS